MNRKTFLSRSMATLAGALILPGRTYDEKLTVKPSSGSPVIISTWKHGVAANREAWKILQRGGRALDAVEKGVNVPEKDPEVHSVGYGSYPDRDGVITLDASIMDENGNGGAVSFLQGIKTPVSVARLVMERTPHVMLAGEGALAFALENGFQKEELRTDFSIQKWEKWKKDKVNRPVDLHNHDTISLLAIDQHGNISGACSTSGIAFKHHGRVGDSPILGAGLFVDNETGGAGATGVGEVVMKTLGSFAIVENMRHGFTPQQACEEVVKRILKKVKDAEKNPVFFIAVNKDGEFGAYGTHAGFEYAISTQDGGTVLKGAGSMLAEVSV